MITKKDEGAITQQEIDDLLNGISLDSNKTPAKKTKTASKGKTSKKSEKPQKNEVLSQDEIDELLSSISVSAESGIKYGDKKVRIYDFKRPDVFSKLQLKSVSNYFEAICQELSSKIPNQIHTFCRFDLYSVDQLTYEEFSRSLPIPSSIGIASFFDNPMLIQIDPTLSFQFVYGELFRDLSEETYSRIKKDLNLRCLYRNEESQIIHNAFIPLFQTFTEVFNKREYNYYENFKANPSPNARNLDEPETIKLEFNPSFANLCQPKEMVICVTLEVNINGEEATINFCFPHQFLKNVFLKENFIMAVTSNGPNFGLEVIPGNSTVSIGEFNMPENAKISEGQIIQLNKLTGEPVDLIDKKTGKVFAKAEVVTIDENFGIRITEVLDKSKEEKN